MKRILITVLLTIFCFGIGLTSLVVNDLANLNTWYQTEVRPTMHKEDHDDHHKELDRENIPTADHAKEWHSNTLHTAPNTGSTPASPAAVSAPTEHTSNKATVPSMHTPNN